MTRTALSSLIAATTLAPCAEAGPVQYLTADRKASVSTSATSSPLILDKAESDAIGRFEGDLFAQQSSVGDSGDTFSSSLHYRSLLLGNRVVTRTESLFSGPDYNTFNRNLKFTSVIEFRLTEATEVSFRLDHIAGEDFTIQENDVSVFSVGADRFLFSEHIDDDSTRNYWSRTLNAGTFRFRLEINEFSRNAGWADHQWVLQLPGPSTASLFGLGVLSLARRRR